jgi:hypothetical protein
MSASQPWCSQGSTRKTPPRWSFRRTRGWLQKYSEACSTRLRRARSLPDLRLRDYAHSIEYSGVRDRACLVPYIYCNYWYASSTSRNRRKLPE